jgi:hypothetical protein
VITGIAFKVSFTGTSIVQNVNSLSGGQRSVLSLALVFAFLMMDRAPFYLLDEADMVNATLKITIIDRNSLFLILPFRHWIKLIAQRWPPWLINFPSGLSSSPSRFVQSCCLTQTTL